MLSYEKPSATRYNKIILVAILLLISLDKCLVIAVWSSWHMLDALVTPDSGKFP